MLLHSSALAVQIYLQMDRLDLARNEVASVKSWAEDALLLQMMEAWVDLRVVRFAFFMDWLLGMQRLIFFYYVGWRKVSRGILYL